MKTRILKRLLCKKRIIELFIPRKKIELIISFILLARFILIHGGERSNLFHFMIKLHQLINTKLKFLIIWFKWELHLTWHKGLKKNLTFKRQKNYCLNLQCINLKKDLKVWLREKILIKKLIMKKKRFKLLRAVCISRLRKGKRRSINLMRLIKNSRRKRCF